MKKNGQKDNSLRYRFIQVCYITLMLLLYQGSYADIKEKNWSLGKPAKESSVAFGGIASKAVDGNRNGNFTAGSVTHTAAQLKPYWEVDLGAVVPIDFIRIYNRTDCCKERLSNVFVFISDKPFKHSDAADVLTEEGVNFSVIWGQAGDNGRDGSKMPLHTARFQGRTYARYVRIQLAGRGWLSLAEVEVIQQENIQGPSSINDAMSWVGTGVNIRQGDFTAIEVNNQIATFQTGADGLIHYTLDFENDEVLNGSPQISSQVAPAAIWDKVNDVIYVAVVTTSGELQVASGRKLKIGFLISRPWIWTTIGRSVKGGDLAINCNKVIAAWLDGDRIKSSFKILNEGAWSVPADVTQGACAPSLASTMTSSSGDFGMAFLRSNGAVCFTRAKCSASLDWGGIENPNGLALGERVGIAAYGDYFALAVLGLDNHPYFSLQVDGSNGLPAWPGFEPVRAVSFEESKIIEVPRLVIFRGMMFVLARDNTKALRSWLRLPNHQGVQSGIGWCGGSIVGGRGTSAVSPRLVPVGKLILHEQWNVPAELYLITSGINDRQLYALNYGRSVSLDLLSNFFHLDLSPNPGNNLDLKTAGNLPEHVMSLISLPDEAVQGVIGKKCNNLTLATGVHLHPLVTGQARPGQCPMELFLNSANQSARFMLHEWMHIDFAQRKIGNLPGFNETFGDPKPKLCDGTNCGGDQCLLADQFTQYFDDPTIIRWAGKKVCVDNDGRPQGGVDFYEFQSAEHAFIETATRYRFWGDELRFLAERDMQRGNPQLKKRYEWIKLRYYGGQEFNGWKSSGYSPDPAVDAGDRSRGFIGRPLR